MRALALILFVLVPAAQGQTVTVHASADSVRVGASFRLTLVARHDAPTPAVFPDTGRAWGGADLAVLERLETGTTPGTAGTRTDSAVYRVAAFALDTLLVPPVAVGFVVGADTLLVPSSPFALPMIATAPADAADLRPARAPLSFPLPLWVWALGVAALAVLVWLAYLLFRRLKRRAPHLAAAPLSPADAARQRLHALAGANLADPDRVKPYYVELTEAVRRYMEETTGLPALEQTSAELIRGAQQSVREGRLPAHVPDQLVALFSVADYAKFADGLPAPEEGHRIREAALLLVEDIEAYRAAEAARAQTAEAADA